MTQAEMRRKFDEIVAFAEVEKFLDTPVKHYSSGMYVRLAFAVAAHLEPEILIVDEVLAVGDAEFQKKCLGKMQDVADGGGRTVLFVSHNMGAITNLCKTAIVLESGKLIFLGFASKALAAYSTSSRADSIPHGGRERWKKARITAIELIDSSGEPARVWDCARNARFRIGLSVSKSLARLELSLRLEAVEGGYAATVFAGRSPSGPMICDVGDYELQLLVKSHCLVPGAYLVTAWLHDPMVELFDLQEKVISLEIANSHCDFALLGTVAVLGPLLMDPLSLVIKPKPADTRMPLLAASDASIPLGA